VLRVGAAEGSALPVAVREAGHVGVLSACVSVGMSVCHRIIEPLRLEKTSKIINSNQQPIATMPAKPCPELPHLHIFFEHFQGW